MNLNSWNYISQVVNLLMDFLFTSTNDPQSVLHFFGTTSKKCITILGICSIKSDRPLDVIISLFEVMTLRLCVL